LQDIEEHAHMDYIMVLVHDYARFWFMIMQHPNMIVAPSISRKQTKNWRRG